MTGRLYSLGINGVEIEDKEDFEEFLEQNNPNWDFVDETLMKKMTEKTEEDTKVKAYVANNASGNETIQFIKDSIAQLKKLDEANEYGKLDIGLSNISEEDWANNWKQFYKPTRIGKKVVIVPEWEKYDASNGDLIVRMNPGAAFGTGTHETTRLCIEFIEEFAGSGTEMLDVGTGSGILAVTALKLGAKSAVGIDIDELAAKVAMENAALNCVEQKFHAFRGDLATGVQEKFNLITANIVADVIIRLAPDVPDHLTEDGIFVASGIIDTREEEVRGELERCGLHVFSSKHERGWAALACKRGR